MWLGRLAKRGWLMAACAACVAVTNVSPGQAAKTLIAPAAQQQQQAPYNVIYILVDDLRFDAMGFLNPGLKTPNIDYLAKNGVYFPNAVVTSSLCSPSRATILTGMTARNHGVISNADSSEEGLVFFPSYLQQAGYQTGFFGKWHMGSASDMPRPGFDRWVSFKGQGTYFPTDHLSAAAIAKGQRQMLNVDGEQVPRRGYITDELTDYALDWLNKSRDQSKPFFLYLSHKAVHSEPLPPKRYAHQYEDFNIQLPASMADTPENNAGKPLWVQNQRNSWHGADFPYHTNRPLTEQVRAYYQTLSPVDDSVGRILAYLRRHHLDKNTMIVFTSDNGFLIGDHGLIDKRNAYEPSVRVPMITYAPGLVPKGITSPALIRNLDLAPTFLDLAHVEKPKQMEGTSWLQVATGKMPAADYRPSDFVYEYYWEWPFPQTPTTFAIVRDRLKYIQYHGVWDTEELYDLQTDPNEMHNLIADPAWQKRLTVLRHALFTELTNTRGSHFVPYMERTGPGRVYRDVDGDHAADFPERWYVKPVGRVWENAERDANGDPGGEASPARERPE